MENRYLANLPHPPQCYLVVFYPNTFRVKDNLCKVEGRVGRAAEEKAGVGHVDYPVGLQFLPVLVQYLEVEERECDFFLVIY